jgi:hypothetical protein
MDDITLSSYEVTCRTENCWNNGHTIPMQAPSVDPNFICGVCNQPITDVTKLDTPTEPTV